MAPDGADRHGLGCPKTCKNLGIKGEHGAESFQYGWRHGRTGRNNAAKGRELYAMFGPVASHAINQGRGTEHIGYVEVFDGLDYFFRVNVGGMGRIHVRYNSSHA